MRFGSIDGTLSVLTNVIYDSGYFVDMPPSGSTVTIALDGNRDKVYEVIVLHTADNYITFNGDTGANYGDCHGRATESTKQSWSDGSATSFTLGGGAAGSPVLTRFICTAETGYTRKGIGFTGNDYNLHEFGFVWGNTVDNITTMEITSVKDNDRIIVIAKGLNEKQRTGDIDLLSDTAGVWLLEYETQLSQAASSVTISGIDGDKDCMYRLLIKLHGQPDDQRCYLYFNDDNSGANYRQQLLAQSIGTYTAAQRSDYASMFELIERSNNDNVGGFADTWMYVGTTGYTRPLVSFQHGFQNEVGVTGHFRTVGGAWGETADNVSSITITGTVMDGLGVGTCIQLWKLNI